MNTLEKISHETMVFMRGKYRLDEIGDGKDEAGAKDHPYHLYTRGQIHLFTYIRKKRA